MTRQENLQESRRIEALERRVTNLERITGRFMTDIFDRIAAAIEAKNSGDNAAYDAHFTALDQQYSALQGVEAGDATNIAALQAGLGKIADAVNPPPAPKPAASLTVSPVAINGTVGQAITGSLSVSGGTSPYGYSSSLSDIFVDASGNVTGTPAAAEDGTITVTDTSTPPLTVSVPVTIAAAAAAAA